MKTIYKYEIKISALQALYLPKGAKILCLQIDEKDNKPYIWAEVDTTTAEVDQWHFSVIGTGSPIYSNNRKYIGTIQQDGFVWHLYEIFM